MSGPAKTTPCTKFYQFKALLLRNGWMSPAYIGVDDNGLIGYQSSSPPNKAEVEVVDGYALPGFYNCHSHAFQFAMAGMAELHKPGTKDDFWSWREAMYRCALSLDPDQIQTVATALYIEMLKRGYTHVVEFHYLHHDKNGRPYTNPSETSIALLAAAAVAGIKITLVPVFYQKGGFGKPAEPGQRRFTFQTVDQYFRLLEEATSVARPVSTASVGFGVHSLRAAEAADIIDIVSNGPKDIPFHMHAAEQLRELDDCVAYSGLRPVQWIVRNLPVSDRFNLVHCTHLQDDEVEALARSQANAVLCPGTEGNLGDGFFRLADYSERGGRWCIGTDSHISLNPLEDLRWLDYGQRLLSHKRNTFDDGGLSILNQVFFSGAKSAGISRPDYFAPGTSFDAVVFNASSRLLADTSTDYTLSRILYTADSAAVFGTLVNGRWAVKKSFHHEEDRVSSLFRDALRGISTRS